MEINSQVFKLEKKNLKEIEGKLDQINAVWMMTCKKYNCSKTPEFCLKPN